MENSMLDAMPANPQQLATLVSYAERLTQSEHGNRRALFDALAADLGVSLRTAYRWLKDYYGHQRKRRNDAGKLSLTRDEAEIVCGSMLTSVRANGKGIGKLTHRVEQLRANRLIRAERIDPSTGEILPLSDTSIARALRAYHLHPDQLRTPTPHVRLSTPHPNHTWQVDASVCVVFYLPGGGVGIYELKDGVHYKNKPANLKAIEAFRVIRYVVTDHCSGTIRWRYYPHAESGQHTVRLLAWGMAPKSNPADPFHGAPYHVMVDPGVTAAGLVQRFCRRAEINLIVNRPGNSRANGSVEKGQDIVEIRFESALKYIRDEVQSFDDLNRLADQYQLHFNATAEHSRHGKSRFDKWLEIRPEELRVTPNEEVLLSLATNEPEARRVDGDLTVRFKNRVWNVVDVPGVTRGGTIKVHWHPFRPDTAMAVFDDEAGREIHLPLPEIEKDQHGSPSNAIQINERYRAMPDTVLETNRKTVLKRTTGEAPLFAAEAVSQKRGHVPFGGAFDPLKTARETASLSYLPRAGTALEIEPPQVQSMKLTATRAALWLQARMADAWRPEYFQWLEQRFPDGIPEDQLEQLAAQWLDSGSAREAEAC
ncbi:MAG: integrase [Burkholderia gladioli]